MKTAIIEILERDLKKLSDEIGGYSDEAQIWKTADGINNSAGTLCLHLCGNLQHFIGAVLGNSGYVRNRDEEFSLKNIPKEKLLKEIETTKQVVRATLEKLDDETLKKDYPSNILGKIHPAEYFLVHLISHFNYHLGQINYHRRLVK